MGKKISAMLLAFCLMLFLACNTSKSKINNLEEDILYVESNMEQVTENGWDNLENKIHDLEKDLKTNRENYSDDEIKDLGRLQGRYASLLVNKKIKDFSKSYKDLGNQLEGFVEGIQSNHSSKKNK